MMQKRAKNDTEGNPGRGHFNGHDRIHGHTDLIFLFFNGNFFKSFIKNKSLLLSSCHAEAGSETVIRPV